MIKNKYNETRNLKIWEVLSENKKNQKSLQHFGKGAASSKEETVPGAIEGGKLFYNPKKLAGEGAPKVISKKER